MAVTSSASCGVCSILTLARNRLSHPTTEIRSQSSTTIPTNLPPPQPPPATAILSLPPELVDLILSSCTNSSLLALSQTCSGLHAITLHAFFKRNNIQDPVSGWLSARKAPRETLEAIRVSLFVKKLSMINWYFNPGWECIICNSGEEDEDSDERGVCLCRPESQPNSSMGAADAGSRMGPLKRTFDEVASLRAIVSRLQDVGSVSLHFSVVDSWITMQARKGRISLKQVDSDLWRTAVIRLLDEVLDKGCEKLNIYVGEKLNKLYRDELPVLVTEQADNSTTRHEGGNHADTQVRNQSRNRFLETSLRPPLKCLMGFVHRIVKTSNEPTIPSQWNSKSLDPGTTWNQIKLKDLRIHSDMLFLPPFYDWTMSLLSSSACASTLTRLSFKTDSISIPSPFLASVTLPNLVDFEITAVLTIPRNGSETGRAKFEDVAMFLGRHSKHLRKVHLYGAGVPTSLDRRRISGSTTASAAIFAPLKPIFPLLQSFNAHPAYIIWLLELAISAPATSLFGWRRNTTLGNLTSIGITSEYYRAAPDFHYVLFDQALSAVVRFCRWRNGEIVASTGNWDRPSRRRRRKKKKKIKEEKTIELMLTFASQEGVGEWFASHLPSSLEHSPTNQTNSVSPAPIPASPSILTQLTQVSVLTVSTFHFVKLPDSTVDNLPEWLALFSRNSNTPGSGTPSTLRSVKFVDYPSEGFLGDEDLFVKRVAEKCVGLKWMHLRWKSRIDLDLIRAELEAGRGDVDRA